MIRKTRPTAGNKYYITKSSGGYSTCIKGKPTDSQCDVLSNCVGYGNGAFNEELDLGYEKYHFNCNAENFIERAIAAGLSVVKEPIVGGMLVWEGKGSLAGHTDMCIEKINSNCIKTADSGYGSKTPFWIATRYNNTGRWGLNENYIYRGCIVNPNYPPSPEPPTPPEPPVEEFKVGDKVVPIKLVNYTGTPLIQYDKYYFITELVGDRAVLSALRNGKYYTWAAMNTNNIKKVIG